MAKCKYFDNLKFLSDKVSNKETESNVKLPAPMSAKSSVDIENSFLEISSNKERKRKNEEDGANSTTVVKPLSKSQRVNQQVDTMLVKALKDLEKTSSEDAVCKEIDSDLIFCQSIHQSLKKLSPRENMLARMKIQKILFEFRFGGEDTVLV